jgi:hypothetical protein
MLPWQFMELLILLKGPSSLCSHGWNVPTWTFLFYYECTCAPLLPYRQAHSAGPSDSPFLWPDLLSPPDYVTVVSPGALFHSPEVPSNPCLPSPYYLSHHTELPRNFLRMKTCLVSSFPVRWNSLRVHWYLSKGSHSFMQEYFLTLLSPTCFSWWRGLVGTSVSSSVWAEDDCSKPGTLI